MYERCIDNQELCLLATAVLNQGHELQFKARGRSMLPLIRDGDVLLVVPASQVHLGDVVLCPVDDDRCLAHRITRIYANGDVRLQGDNNWHSDGIYPPARILGKVITITRSNRTIALDQGLRCWLGLIWCYIQPVRTCLWKKLRPLFGRSFDYHNE